MQERLKTLKEEEPLAALRGALVTLERGRNLGATGPSNPAELMSREPVMLPSGRGPGVCVDHH